MHDTRRSVYNAAMSDGIEQILDGRTEHVGAFSVHRVLPFRKRRAVGPFVFLDHMGPAALEPGHGAEVRPHPHIGLATVTYLFEGHIVHRDSVGSEQDIRPGDVNWMTAGRGIVHSERSPQEVLDRGGALHGIQAWVALPIAHEETAPAFAHHPMRTLPERTAAGVALRLIAGEAWGLRSPVAALSPLFYAHVDLEAGAEVSLPTEHVERAAYVVSGRVECPAAGAEPTQGTSHDHRATSAWRGWTGVDGSAGHGTRPGSTQYQQGQMLVFAAGGAPVVRASADGPARVMLLGGAPLDAPRFMFWNFVSSSHDRIEQAKRDWAEGRFARVPGDQDSGRMPHPAE